jgi:translocator protein
MAWSFDSLGRAWPQVAWAVGLVTLLNAGIYYLGFGGEDVSAQGRFLHPLPGFVVPGVWTLLFAGLGWSRWRIGRSGVDGAGPARKGVLTLILACAAYPFYTAGFRWPFVGLLGNVATLALSGSVVLQLRRISIAAAVPPILVCFWLLFASFYLIDQERWLW